MKYVQHDVAGFPAAARSRYSPGQVAASIWHTGEVGYQEAVAEKGTLGHYGAGYARGVDKYLRRADTLICGSGIYTCQ